MPGNQSKSQENQVDLGSVASIQTGFSFRSACSFENTGCLVVLLKDIDSEGFVDMEGLGRVEPVTSNESNFVVAGDLIFRSRGGLFTAGVVPEIGEPLLLAAPLLRIRVDQTQILPEYLAWYINSSWGETYFEGVAEGSAMKMVSKTSLAALPLSLPSLPAQQRVAELVALERREQSLVSMIHAKRKQWIDARIKQFVEST